MQITRATEYAIRIILDLVAQDDLSQPVTIAEISERQKVPDKYLRKIIMLLINAGFIRSYRGPKGGLVLIKPPAEITLYDIIKVTEGEINLNVCLISENECDRHTFCPLYKVWCKAQEAMLRELKGVTLATLGQDLRTILLK